MEIKSTSVFDKWHDSLKDVMAKARIDRRIKRAARGEYGEVAPVGEDVAKLCEGLATYLRAVPSLGKPTTKTARRKTRKRVAAGV